MKKIIVSVIAFIMLIVLYSSYFIVNEIQQVIITRYGKTVGEPISKAGIYFKIHMVDKANYFERRILEWDGDPNQIPTKDKKNIMVDTTARWKIVDPLMFLQSVGSERSAQTRLDDIIDSSVRNVISQHDIIEIVRNSNRVVKIIKQESITESFASAEDQQTIAKTIEIGRDELTREILKKSKPIIKKYGIELIDVRIKGLMYSNAVLETVYQRMISQYGIKAQNLRSEGDKKKALIEGDTELDVKTIRSTAYKKSQTIRGEGDGEAAKIYAETLKIDPGFYHFQRSLDAYKQAVSKNSTFILSADSEFFRVLKNGI